MKNLVNIVVFFLLFLHSFTAVSQQVITTTCNNCSTSLIDLTVEGYVMQRNLADGEYTFIVVDSKTFDVHRLKVDVERSAVGLANDLASAEDSQGVTNSQTNESSESEFDQSLQENAADTSGINLNILVTIQHLGLTSNLQQVEIAAKQAKRSLDEIRQQLSTNRNIFRIPASSGFPSATYAVTDSQVLGDVTGQLITDHLDQLNASRSFADAFVALNFYSEHAIDSVISNLLNTSRVVTYTVEFADGTQAEIELTLSFRSQFNGVRKLAAHAHYTRNAWFVNGARIPLTVTQLENIGEVTHNMASAAGMAALIAHFNIPLQDPGGLFASPPPTGRLDYCIRVTEFIEDPFTGRKIGIVSQDCND